MALNHERHGHVGVWWFPKDFSQSRYGKYKSSGTNSCTIISLMLADMVAKSFKGRHGFHEYLDNETPNRRCIDQLPREAINIFAEAINEGNGVYQRAICPSKMCRQNLSIPDALKAMKSQPRLGVLLHEWFYTHLQANPASMGYAKTAANKLTQVLSIAVELFRHPTTVVAHREKFLFAALIADSRTVIMVFEFPTEVVSFFDSHQHGMHAGAVIAQCALSDLGEMMSWMMSMLHEMYDSKPELFEVSFLTTIPEGLPNPIK